MKLTTQDPEKQLDWFIGKFSPEVARLAKSVLVKMRKRYPTAVELVYDNYNALAIGFSPGERAMQAVFSIALYPRWVSLFFLQAKGMPDPDGLFQGNGKVARHIRLESAETLDDPKVRRLMDDAVARAVLPFDPEATRRVIIKSVCAKQRPRVPIEAPRKKR